MEETAIDKSVSVFSAGLPADKLRTQRQDRTRSFMPKITQNDMRRLGVPASSAADITNEQLTDFFSRLFVLNHQLKQKLETEIKDCEFLYASDEDKLNTALVENEELFEQAVSDMLKKVFDINLLFENGQEDESTYGTQEHNSEWNEIESTDWFEWKTQTVGEYWYKD